MDILLQQGRDEYKAMLDLTEPIHRAYAKRHKMAYIRYDGPFVMPWIGYWDQIALYRSLLGMPSVERIFWLDADTLIGGDGDLRDGLGDGDLAMARHPGPPEHWNCGVLFIRNSPAVQEFFRLVIERGPGDYPWYQQAVMNQIISEGYPLNITQLDTRWNNTFILGHADPDPVILAWHGFPGGLDGKLAVMEAYIRELERA